MDEQGGVSVEEDTDIARKRTEVILVKSCEQNAKEDLDYETEAAEVHVADKSEQGHKKKTLTDNHTI